MEMALHQRLNMNLKMTPELRQAITLLQYSTYDLEQYIKEQELENPLIELRSKAHRSNFEEKSYHIPRSKNVVDITNATSKFSIEVKRDDLYESARLMYSDFKTLTLLKFIIFNLNESGYFLLHSSSTMPLNNYSEQEISNGIRLLQKIGPFGIGARSLKECLLLQISNLFPMNCLAMEIVENDLDLIANHRWSLIASKYKVSMEDVLNVYSFIQTLNPRPCSFLSSPLIEYVTPDIIVDEKNGSLTFSLNDDYLPTIGLNKNYISKNFPDRDTAKYINTHYQKYTWLVSSIEQRRNTIIKIVEVLLFKQRQFFLKGFSHLQPLTLREVADEIGMHESTVSRATANKTINTPFGSYELRLLFSSKLERKDGTSISQTKLKNLLMDLIKSENKFHPFSDQKIAQYFTMEKGITISRRTIAKYREELNIPPSSRRKEIKL